MNKIVEQHGSESLAAISRVLVELGFDLHLTGSEHYNCAKLKSLAPNQVERVKEAFARHRHLRFGELVCGKHQPFGRNSDYVLTIQAADLHKMSKLIKIHATLLQAKVYLLWIRDEKRAEQSKFTKGESENFEKF